MTGLLLPHEAAIATIEDTRNIRQHLEYMLRDKNITGIQIKITTAKAGRYKFYFILQEQQYFPSDTSILPDFITELPNPH